MSVIKTQLLKLQTRFQLSRLEAKMQNASGAQARILNEQQEFLRKTLSDLEKGDTLEIQNSFNNG